MHSGLLKSAVLVLVAVDCVDLALLLSDCFISSTDEGIDDILGVRDFIIAAVGVVVVVVFAVVAAAAFFAFLAAPPSARPSVLAAFVANRFCRVANRGFLLALGIVVNLIVATACKRMQ